jgi:hypothetical protein
MAPCFFWPLYPALRHVKAAFDKRDQLTPGKIATVRGDGLLKIDPSQPVEEIVRFRL